MVLRLKTRESRSLPGLLNATKIIYLFSHLRLKPNAKAALKALYPILRNSTRGGAAPPTRRRQKPSRTGKTKQPGACAAVAHVNAGWSSPVARQAHNLKAAGSNPAPATRHNTTIIKTPWINARGFGVSRAGRLASHSARRRKKMLNLTPLYLPGVSRRWTTNSAQV